MSDKTKYVPNSYQTPNVFVDEIMPYLTPEEWVVLSYAIRHIYGWGETIGKRRAKISLSHFTEGIEGDNYRNGCGLSRQTVSKCLKSLIEYGILSKVGGATSDGQEYELTQTADVDKLQDVKRQLDIKRTVKMSGLRQRKHIKKELAVYSIDQSTVKTDSGLQHRPEAVYTIDTIKHTSQTHSQTQLQDAPVVTKKKTPKPIHPLNQKDSEGQNPYFNLVLQYSFTANPNSKADSNGIGGRVGKVLAKLIPLYDELGGFTPTELESAYQRLRQDKGSYMATDAEKVYGQLSPYLRRLVTENNTVPAAPVVKPRPDIMPRVGTRRLDALQPLMPRKENN